MRKLNTFTFLCTFECDLTGEEKQFKKEYKAFNYLDARIGLRRYFADNKTINTLVELERI